MEHLLHILGFKGPEAREEEELKGANQSEEHEGGVLNEYPHRTREVSGLGRYKDGTMLTIQTCGKVALCGDRVDKLSSMSQ